MIIFLPARRPAHRAPGRLTRRTSAPRRRRAPDAARCRRSLLQPVPSARGDERPASRSPDWRWRRGRCTPVRNPNRGARLDERPTAHVLRFFLHPHPFLGFAITPQRALQRLLGEGIELLDADDGYFVRPGLGTAFQQIVINLAAAQKHPTNARRLHRGIVENFLETAVDKFVQRRAGRF